MTQYNNQAELLEGFQEAGTHSWPIQDARGDHYLVSCTEDGDVFAQGLPFADEDGSNYDKNLHSISDGDGHFEAAQYPFTALAAVRPSPVALELGADLAVGDAAMLVHTYAVHAAMLEQAGPNLPRNPTIMIDLEGFVDAGSPTQRLLIPEPLAIAIRDGVNVSLGQLENVRKADGQ